MVGDDNILCFFFKIVASRFNIHKSQLQRQIYTHIYNTMVLVYESERIEVEERKKNK